MNSNSISIVRAITLAVVSISIIMASARAGFQARAAEKRMTEKNDAPATRLAERAERMLAWGDPDGALETAKAGLALEPGYIPLWLLKARAHLARKEYALADDAIGVCLLRDAKDVRANLFRLVSLTVRDDFGADERERRVAALLDAFGDNLFADILAQCAGRRDFPELLSPILAGWRNAARPMADVRDSLRLFTGGRADGAAVVLASVRDELPRELAESLRSFYASFGREGGGIPWACERGRLVRNEEGGYSLLAGPGQEAFARMRMSRDWRDVEGRVAFADDAAPANLYLRYASPEAYVRLRAEDGVIYVQERVPDHGLSTIFTCALAELRDGVLRFALKGERLDLRGGGGALTDAPLPVSFAIASGNAAVSCENAGPEEHAAVFRELLVTRIEERWRRLGGDAGADRADAPGGFDCTGVVVRLDGSAEGGRELAAALIAANANGVAVYGELPEGSFELDALEGSVGGLSARVTRRLWNGVVFRPKRGSDWRRVEKSIRLAAKRGLRTAIVLSPETAADLAAREADFSADWGLLENADVMDRDLGKKIPRFYKSALFAVPGSGGEYSSLSTAAVPLRAHAPPQ